MSAVAAGTPITWSIAGVDNDLTALFGASLQTRVSSELQQAGFSVLSFAPNISISSDAWSATVVTTFPDDDDTDSLAVAVNAAIASATGNPATSVSAIAVGSSTTGLPGASTSTGIFDSLLAGLNGLTSGTATLASVLPILAIGAIVLAGVIVFQQSGTIVKRLT